MNVAALSPRHRWIWFAIVAAMGCAASPPVSLGIGIAVGLALTQPFPAETKRVSKLALQVSVVGLGFGMTFRDVIHAGANGFLFAAATIVMTYAAGWVIGRWLKVDRVIGWLIATGTAICGGSAIAAVSVAIEADASETTVAIGTVFLLNAVALYLFPVLGTALHLDQQTFGTWVGVAIHDVSSVVGAASVFGDQALVVATAVKLSRILWLLPIVLASQRIFADRAHGSAKRPPFPWFIVFFLLAALLRENVSALAPTLPTLRFLALSGLSASLFMIGAGISPKALREVGARPLLLGAALWAIIGTISLAALMLHLA